MRVTLPARLIPSDIFTLKIFHRSYYKDTIIAGPALIKIAVVGSFPTTDSEKRPKNESIDVRSRPQAQIYFSYSA